MKKHFLILSLLSLFSINSFGQTTIELVKDINPNGSSNPVDFDIYNGILYFRAENSTNNTQLWVSDGTTDGTQLLILTATLIQAF